MKTLNKADNYRSYIRSVLRMFAFMDAGLFDSDEADALREQMVEPWYALSKEERKRMDGLVLDLTELRESRKSTEPRELTEAERAKGELRAREYLELKEVGKFDEALELLRKWQSVIAPQVLWHSRGSCWNLMGVPDVGAEFYGEATRLAPDNELSKPAKEDEVRRSEEDSAPRIG
jgi:hypothetical protein